MPGMSQTILGLLDSSLLGASVSLEALWPCCAPWLSWGQLPSPTAHRLQRPALHFTEAPCRPEFLPGSECGELGHPSQKQSSICLILRVKSPVWLTFESSCENKESISWVIRSSFALTMKGEHTFSELCCYTPGSPLPWTLTANSQFPTRQTQLWRDEKIPRQVVPQLEMGWQWGQGSHCDSEHERRRGESSCSEGRFSNGRWVAQPTCPCLSHAELPPSAATCK